MVIVNIYTNGIPPILYTIEDVNDIIIRIMFVIWNVYVSIRSLLLLLYVPRLYVFCIVIYRSVSAVYSANPIIVIIEFFVWTPVKINMNVKILYILRSIYVFVIFVVFILFDNINEVIIMPIIFERLIASIVLSNPTTSLTDIRKYGVIKYTHVYPNVFSIVICLKFL